MVNFDGFLLDNVCLNHSFWLSILRLVVIVLPKCSMGRNTLWTWNSKNYINTFWDKHSTQKIALFCTFKVFLMFDVIEGSWSSWITHASALRFLCIRKPCSLWELCLWIRMKRQMFKCFHRKSIDLIDWLKYPRERHLLVLCYFTKSAYWIRLWMTRDSLPYCVSSLPGNFVVFFSF